MKRTLVVAVLIVAGSIVLADRDLESRVRHRPVPAPSAAHPDVAPVDPSTTARWDLE